VGDNKPVSITDIQTVDRQAANYTPPDTPASGTDINNAAIVCANIPESMEFNASYQNAPQIWTPSESGYYFFEAWGAGGGSVANGGYGGFSRGHRWVEVGNTVYINTGRAGGGHGNQPYNGGGSSYIRTDWFTNPVMIDGQGYAWSLDSMDYSLGIKDGARLGVTEPNGNPHTYGHLGNGHARITMKKNLVFRGEAYGPDDFTAKQINLINYRNDTISLLETDGIDLSCTDCHNASDTARLHIVGLDTGGRGRQLHFQ
jgi:hypothetical protein